MATATKAAPKAAFIPPTTVAYVDTKPATDETLPAGPYAGLTVFEADAFVPAVKGLDPDLITFVKYLASKGEAVVIIDGWATERVAKFLTTVRKCREAYLGGRRTFARQGTVQVEGRPVPALLLTLSNDSPTTQPTVAAEQSAA